MPGLRLIIDDSRSPCLDCANEQMNTTFCLEKKKRLLIFMNRSCLMLVSCLQQRLSKKNGCIRTPRGHSMPFIFIKYNNTARPFCPNMDTSDSKESACYTALHEPMDEIKQGCHLVCKHPATESVEWKSEGWVGGEVSPLRCHWKFVTICFPLSLPP